MLVTPLGGADEVILQLLERPINHCNGKSGVQTSYAEVCKQVCRWLGKSGLVGLVQSHTLAPAKRENRANPYRKDGLSDLTLVAGTQS